MTQSLTERLQERLEAQTAEIEALTVSELKRLASSLKSECSAVLYSTQSDIHETTEVMDQSLRRLRRFGRYWWVALILTWLVIGGLSAWHLMQPPTAGIALYQTFEYEGRNYLMLPEGTEALTCLQGEQRMPCVMLPRGE